MNKEREFIQGYCYRMQIGERAKFARRIFQEAFPSGFPTIYENCIQAFLSSMIGSAWGAWRCQRNPETGDYIVDRGEVDPKNRVYVDPDREYLFDKNPDGTLTRRSEKNG